MDIFNYLMNKKGKNLFYNKKSLSYLLGKNVPHYLSGTSIELDGKNVKIQELKMTKESTQETTTGKNKFDKQNTNWYRNNGTGFIDTSNVNTTRIRTSSFQIQGNKTYVISGIPSGISLLRYVYYDSEQNYLGTGNFSNSSFTLTSDTAYINIQFSGVDFTDATNTLMANANIQIEEGTTPTTYEEYTGGVASPNPSYPQEVKTVKTNVTITITDGTNTNTETIPLGDNEICGIGNYKDELIVDKNGHCYLNKKIGKVVLNGSESWAVNQSVYYLAISDKITGKPGMFCNNFIYNTLSCQLQPNYSISEDNTTKTIFIKDYDYTTISDFKSWLSTHNTDVYYVLATENLIDLNYTVDMTLYEGTNTITNSEDMDMDLIYHY